MDELGIEIHFVKEGQVISPDSRSSESSCTALKFMHGIKVLMAKNYIDNLSEETRKGMLEKAREGMWPSCAPLGYRSRHRKVKHDSVMRAVQEHQAANFNYMDAGVQLLELAQRAPKLFRMQTPSQKRRLLGFVLSNCVWKDGELTAEFRQPFDLIALAANQARKPVASERSENPLNKEWLLR